MVKKGHNNKGKKGSTKKSVEKVEKREKKTFQKKEKKEVEAEEDKIEVVGESDSEEEKVEVPEELQEIIDEQEEAAMEVDDDCALPADPVNDPYLLKDAEYIKTDSKWRNKQRTLVFASRGIIGQHRHLMEDFKKMMPHHKSENKFEKGQDFKIINEVAELSSCNNVIFFEARKHEDLYMWVSRVPHGPSFKFQVLNIHTSQEIKLSGNCLQGSRPLLTFDAPFDEIPHLKLIKELFIQTFGTPRNHPKSKPFHDHVLSFYYVDGKIWSRHYQVQPLTESDINNPEKQTLTEIGPRFVLDPIRIMDKSFTGQSLYINEKYNSPCVKRKIIKEEKGVLARSKEHTKQVQNVRRDELRQEGDKTMDIFQN